MELAQFPITLHQFVWRRKNWVSWKIVQESHYKNNKSKYFPIFKILSKQENVCSFNITNRIRKGIANMAKLRLETVMSLKSPHFEGLLNKIPFVPNRKLHYIDKRSISISIGRNFCMFLYKKGHWIWKKVVSQFCN